MIPPYLFDLRVAEKGKRPVHVWLPLFLLWPLGIVLFALAFVVTAVLDVLLLAFGQRYHHYTLFLLGCLEMMSQTRGLIVHVRGVEEATVDLTVL
jgi:hypothetical protein